MAEDKVFHRSRRKFGRTGVILASRAAWRGPLWIPGQHFPQGPLDPGHRFIDELQLGSVERGLGASRVPDDLESIADMVVQLGDGSYAVADDFAFVLFIPGELIKQPPGRDTRNQSADEHQIAPRHAFSQQGKIKNKTKGGDNNNHHKSE